MPQSWLKIILFDLSKVSSYVTGQMPFVATTTSVKLAKCVYRGTSTRQLFQRQTSLWPYPTAYVMNNWCMCSLPHCTNGFPTDLFSFFLQENLKLMNPVLWGESSTSEEWSILHECLVELITSPRKLLLTEVESFSPNYSEVYPPGDTYCFWYVANLRHDNASWLHSFDHEQ